MKNILFLFLILSVGVQAQIMKYRSTQFVCTKFQNQVLDPPEFKDLKDMAIEFSMDSSVLTIHSPAVQVFHLENKPFRAFEKDSSVTYQFRGVDQKGVKCVVTHVIHESEKPEHLGYFELAYSDKTYLYYVDQ